MTFCDFSRSIANSFCETTNFKYSIYLVWSSLQSSVILTFWSIILTKKGYSTSSFWLNWSSINSLVDGSYMAKCTTSITFKAGNSHVSWRIHAKIISMACSGCTCSLLSFNVLMMTKRRLDNETTWKLTIKALLVNALACDVWSIVLKGLAVMLTYSFKLLLLDLLR